MTYSPYICHYPTNPASAICDYYGIDWNDVWTMDWFVPYEREINHLLVKPNGHGLHVSIYRLHSGTYEVNAYDTGKL